MAAPAAGALGRRVVGGARGVHEGEDRDAEPVGEPDEPRGGTESGRAGGRTALGGEGDGAPLTAAESAPYAGVDTAAAVAADLLPVVEVGAQIRLGARPPGRAGADHRIPAGPRQPG